MARRRRSWVNQEVGSYHVISRIARNDVYFHDEEKERFLRMLERYAAGFFVRVHAFTILGNHFHILISGMETEAGLASVDELYKRYRAVFGKMADPPVGRVEDNGEVLPDEDGGVERLRARLGSVSRFVQELKQSFSWWYNKRHNRKGYLWADRFKGVIVDKGDAQLACSAYIDLNSVRAGLSVRPEDYRWSSMGFWVRNKKRARLLLNPIAYEEIGEFKDNKENKNKWRPGSRDSLFREFYREFVYRSGGLEKENKGNISAEIVEQVILVHGKLSLGDRLRYRMRNISEGVALGKSEFIAKIQNQYKRKIIKPRSVFMGGERLFATRVLLD